MQAIPNRERILDVCLGLFADRGFEAVGVQEMCAESGVTKPTVYHYFGSKRGVLDAVVADYGERARKIVLPACGYEGDVKNALEGVFFAFREFCRKEAPFFRLYLSLSSAPTHSQGFEAMLPFRMGVTGAIEDLFEAASAQHGNMKGRAKAYAWSFLGLTHAWTLLEMNGFLNLDDGTVRAAVHQFMHGIFS